MSTIDPLPRILPSRFGTIVPGGASIKERLRRRHPLVFATLHLANRAREYASHALFVVGLLPRLWRLRFIARRMRQTWGNIVVSGPFAGMRYSGDACGSVAPAKQLGSYELELHEVVARVIEDRHYNIINIGAAEGYYAVGLARALPEAHVSAFDVSENARLECKRLAMANDVHNVTNHGRCDAAMLRSLTTRPAFVLSDCEGAEIELLDPARVPGLRQCELLIELHEHLVKDETQQLLDRFAEDHRSRLIPASARAGSDYPQLEFLSPKLRNLAVNEFRAPGQKWLHLCPRNRAMAAHCRRSPYSSDPSRPILCGENSNPDRLPHQ